jgi:hypothetical protein
VLKEEALHKEREIFNENPISHMTSITFSEDDNCFISESDGLVITTDDDNNVLTFNPKTHKVEKTMLSITYLVKI